jgi:hypothetical protein
MVFDPSYQDIDMSRFKTGANWTPIYGDVQEAIPDNAPIPGGKEVDIRLHTDADHAGETVTRRSWTGYILFLNGAPIDWFSKREPTIESSVFGSEFVAAKTGMEKNRGQVENDGRPNFGSDLYVRRQFVCYY